jgi:hypothetical protein
MGKLLKRLSSLCHDTARPPAGKGWRWTGGPRFLLYRFCGLFRRCLEAAGLIHFSRLTTGCGRKPNRYNVFTVGAKMGKSDDTGVPDNKGGRATRMQAVKGLSMEKWLCWATMGVSGLLLILFLLDLVLSIPFGGLSKALDVILAVACGLGFYLGWDAFQDVR